MTNKYLASVAIIAVLFSMTSCAVAQTRSTPESILDAKQVLHSKQVEKIVEQGKPSHEDLSANLPAQLQPPSQGTQSPSVRQTNTDIVSGTVVEVPTDLQAAIKEPDISEELPTPTPETEPMVDTGEEAGIEIGVEAETTTELASDEHPHTWPIDISDQYTEIIAGVPIIENPKSCGQGNLEIGVTVKNISKNKGVIVADLHDDVRENFLVWDKVVLRVRAHAHKGEIFFCMPLTRPGDYAIAIYHDKNGNKEFDKNFLGIPKERFGMSNNPRFGTRSPKYEESIFTVPETGKEILIKLRKASDVLGRQN